MAIGAFGWEALRAQRGDIADLSSLTREAACYYLNDRDRARPGWRYPRFRVAEPATPESAEQVLTIGGSVQQALAREAQRQSVTSDRLLQHALLYYLADLHSGRVARRVVDDLD